MLRAAIYARYSSDNQNDRSVDDQIALCRDICEREGWMVAGVFEDRSISGSSTANRPGFKEMMRALERRAFDVLVAEDMDRVFRDQADYHNARKRFEYHGVPIHTASGKVGKLDGSLRALMGEFFIDNLKIHVVRAMEGIVRDGRHAGGKPYGYRPVPGKPSELQIVDKQAEVIRRIFKECIEGRTVRDIAGRLNKDKIVPPSGLRWNA